MASVYKDYSFKFRPRNLNKELSIIQKEPGLDDPKLALIELKARYKLEARKKAFVDKFKKMSNPWFKCYECGKLIPNDFNVVQRHFIQSHRAENHKEDGFKITPVPRVRSVII